MNPGDLFDCQPLRCRLSAGACVARQAARYSLKKGPVYEPCGSGTCEQGNLIRLGLPSGFQAKRMDWLRPDAHLQRAAKRRWLAERAQDAPTIDTPDIAVEDEESRMVKQAIETRKCACGKILRAGRSVGDKCFACRLRDGDTRKGATRGALAREMPVASPASEAIGPLPDPKKLPLDALKRYAQEFMARLERIASELDGRAA